MCKLWRITHKWNKAQIKLVNDLPEFTHRKTKELNFIPYNSILEQYSTFVNGC